MSNFESFIFTHIPKCGGTSLRRYFYDSVKLSNLEESEIHIPGFGEVNNESNLNQLSEEDLRVLQEKKIRILADHTPFHGFMHYKLNMHMPFYFTVLRDPVERFISHYNFFYYHLGYDDCKGKKLDDLPKEKLIHLLSLLSNVQVKYIAGYNELGKKENKPIEQMYYVASYNLKHRYNCFGLLECLDDSMKLLRKMAPSWLVFIDVVEKKNVNTHMQDKKVNKNTLRMIKEANVYDIQLYSLAKELMKEMEDRVQTSELMQ